MAKPILDDALWALIEPLLPAPKPRRFRFPGRKPVPDRAALTGILFVLQSGIPWERLPSEMGCGSGMTCWRRLRDWQAAGVWARIHLVLLEKLHQAGQIDWSRALVDSRSLRAVGGASTPARAPWTGGSLAPNTTSSPTAAARPWRPGSRALIATT